MISAALVAFFLKKALAENNFWTVNLWYYAIGTFLLGLTFPLFKKDIKNVSKKSWFYISIASIVGAFGNFLAAKAYQSNIGISSAIIAIPLTSIFAIISAFIAPKLLEKHSFKVYIFRFIGIILLVWAGIRLS